MKQITKVLVLGLLAASTSIATAAKFDVKSYHQDVMQDDNGKIDCSTCHGEGKGFSTPSEQVCMDCHGTKQELAEMTEPKGHGHHHEPNPHNSLHYGQDLACSYCHSQHKETEVYCNQCHEFEYPNMKRD